MRAALADENNEDGDDEETELDEAGADARQGQRKRMKARKFRNEDIPGYPRTAQVWREVYLPLWHDFVSTLGDPWCIADELDSAQTLWSKMFPKHRDWTVARKDDPVFFLVRVNCLPNHL